MNDLFIGGGGVTGFKFLGALDYIHNKKLLSVKNFYGCSIGGLIGAYYISGVSPQNLLKNLIKKDLFKTLDYKFDKIVDHKCILDYSVLNELLEELWTIYPETITLLDFYNSTGIYYAITSTNITKNKYETFDHIKHPDVKLKDALIATMCLPFLFKPIKIKGDYYIDGVVKEYLGCPIINNPILGFSITSEHNRCDYSDEVHPMEYLKILFKTVSNRIPNFRSLYHITCKEKYSVYGNLKDINNKMFLDLYKDGIKDAENYIKSLDSFVLSTESFES